MNEIIYPYGVYFNNFFKFILSVIINFILDNHLIVNFIIIGNKRLVSKYKRTACLIPNSEYTLSDVQAALINI